MLTQIDIDDLLQRCRTPNSRTYLKEAVDCYRIGAYRACVICTWIAVVYDIIDKLREIALTGDKKAVAQVKLFDEIQKKRDTDAALKFERDVLGMVRGEFELITAQEQSDLLRLWEDRNRCGHPNLTRDTAAYTPSPELARLHLRIAVEHVLERPPVQGEAAVNLLLETVDSEFFPEEIASAEKVLAESPVARAKASLIEGFIKRALLSLMREDLTSKKQRQRIAAARVVWKMHPISVQAFLERELIGMIAKSSDGCLRRIVWLLAQFPEMQALISGAQETRLKTYAASMPSGDLESLPLALNLPLLATEALARLNTCTEPEFYGMTPKLTTNPGNAFVEKCLNFYVAAHGFHHANIMSTTIVSPLLDYMSPAQIERIVRAVINDQVRGSFNFPSLLSEIIQKNRLTRAALIDILTNAGHANFAEHIPEQAP